MLDVKELPCSLNLEAGIIGYIVSNNELMNHLPFLTREHFYSRPHAEIFAKMRELHDEGQPITPFNLVLDSETLNTVKMSGGLQTYLRGAMSASLTITRPIDDAMVLVRMAQKRNFITICQRASEAALNESDDQTADEHAAALGKRMEDILRSSGASEIEDDYQVTEAILKDMNDDRRPFSTGYPKLDQAMGGGLYPGRAYGFAARKKTGKTIMAASISCNLSLEGVKHLFICGEMGPKEIHQRNLSRLAGASPSMFRESPDRTQAFQRQIAEIANKSKRCILYHNAPGMTFDELRRIACSAVYRYGIKGVILDYWQLVGGKGRGQSTSEHLDEVAQWIADFGRKYGVWTITMAQINQEGNTRGGEGMRLAFDQVYCIKGMGDDEDISEKDRWLEMMDTRYTSWISIGTKDIPGFQIDGRGPYFVQV